MSNYLVGLIRTWVPIGVGVVVSWGLSLGITIEGDTKMQLVAGLTGLAIGLYYTGVTTLAKKFPSIGILLGVNKAPSYGLEKEGLPPAPTE